MLEALQDDFSLPKENQLIVRVLGSRGNNLHEVAKPDGENFLVSMPTKFRKNVWVKRGDYVLVEPIEEGDKVKAEILRILKKEHIKQFKKDNVWPEEFTESAGDERGEDDLFVNTNRPVSESESDGESDNSDSDSSGEECVDSKNIVT